MFGKTSKLVGSVVGGATATAVPSIIGPDMSVRGDVEAATVRVSGSVAGSLRAREVILTATAKMQGDVYHEVLSIEPGALLEGHCRRLEPVLTGEEPLTLSNTAPSSPTDVARLALQAPRRSTH